MGRWEGGRIGRWEDRKMGRWEDGKIGSFGKMGFQIFLLYCHLK
jgi:hypothetical protein